MMIDTIYKVVGQFTIACILISVVWPFVLPAIQALSVTLLGVFAVIKHEGFKNIPLTQLHKVYWRYYKALLFSIGEVTKLENRYYVWRGTFKWHIKGE